MRNKTFNQENMKCTCTCISDFMEIINFNGLVVVSFISSKQAQRPE